MPLFFVRSDITQMQVDAIVNASNTKLLMGRGVSGDIFLAAGANRLQKACLELAPIKTAEAVITPGFNLPAKFVIHTAGPVYRNGEHQEATLLKETFLNCLKLATSHELCSVAFPLISTGTYGYPKEEAIDLAICTIREYLEEHDLAVYLVIYDTKALMIAKELQLEITDYLKENLKEKETLPHSLMKKEAISLDRKNASLEEQLKHLDESFPEALMRLIREKKRKDSDVYKRANVDRKFFSKIKNKKNYIPKKNICLAFAIALELTLEETTALLKRAGYALSRSNLFDVIVEYFILNRKYDVIEINEVLFHYDQPILGASKKE